MAELKLQSDLLTTAPVPGEAGRIAVTATYTGLKSVSPTAVDEDLECLWVSSLPPCLSNMNGISGQSHFRTKQGLESCRTHDGEFQAIVFRVGEHVICSQWGKKKLQFCV